MKLSAFKICEKFNCLAGECPATCCKGWLIPVEDETVYEYQKIKGITGLLLQLSYRQTPYDGLVLKRCGHTCIHFGRDGLCKLQKKGMPECMPQVCKSFPKSITDYGNGRCEMSLELACYNAAKLFLNEIAQNPATEYKYECEIDSDNFQQYAEVNEAVISPLNNDDYAFLDILDRHREECIRYVANAKDFGQAVRNINSQVFLVYEKVLIGDTSAASRLTFEDNSDKDQECNLAFFPVALLNSVFYDWFSNSERVRENKYIARVIAKYKKAYGDIYENQADSYFTRKMQAIFKEDSKIENVFRHYYMYIIIQTYCKAFEDYYMLRSPWLAAIYTEFLMLLYSVNPVKNTEELALFISSAEKALRHNRGLEELLIELIRKELKSK